MFLWLMWGGPAKRSPYRGLNSSEKIVMILQRALRSDHIIHFSPLRPSITIHPTDQVAVSKDGQTSDIWLLQTPENDGAVQRRREEGGGSIDCIA